MAESEKLKRGGLYPLADFPHGLGLEPKDWRNLRAEWTGEFRAPRKGEWYLSGSIIEAYRAPNDLTMKFHIARICRVEVKTVVTERIVEVLA